MGSVRFLLAFITIIVFLISYFVLEVHKLATADSLCIDVLVVV